MIKLHVGNPAGVASNLKKQFDNVVIVNNNKYRYQCDYHININLGNKLESIYGYFRLIVLETKYDIIHSHSRSIPHDMDLMLCKLIGKQIIIHYHGCDIRFKKQPIIHRWLTDKFYVSTPDLLRFVPNAKWIPNPYNRAIKYVQYEKHNPIRILHAPSNPTIKGTKHITSAINALRLEGYNIKFIHIENTDNTSILDAIANSDIVIDWMNHECYPIYGMISIEAMLMGKPVISAIGNYYDKCPIINANKYTLIDVLREVIQYDESKLRSIGIEGREYVQRVHKHEVE